MKRGAISPMTLDDLRSEFLEHLEVEKGRSLKTTEAKFPAGFLFTKQRRLRFVPLELLFAGVEFSSCSSLLG